MALPAFIVPPAMWAARVIGPTVVRSLSGVFTKNASKTLATGALTTGSRLTAGTLGKIGNFAKNHKFTTAIIGDTVSGSHGAKYIGGSIADATGLSTLTDGFQNAVDKSKELAPASLLEKIDLDQTGLLGMGALLAGGAYGFNDFVSGDTVGAINSAAMGLAAKELLEGDYKNAAMILTGGLAASNMLDGDIFQAVAIAATGYLISKFLSNSDDGPQVTPNLQLQSFNPLN